MRAKWIAVLLITLLVIGCVKTTKTEKKRILGKDVFSLEVEDFDLTNAEVQKLADASGKKVVVLKDDTSKAEKTIQLKKGEYKATVYVLGPSPNEDAFYLTIGDIAEERLYPDSTGEILPTWDIQFSQHADGPCKIIFTFAEQNVQLDRIQIKPIS